MIGRGSSGTVYEIQKDILVGVEKAALKVISLPQTGSDIDEMYSDGLDTQLEDQIFTYGKEYGVLPDLSRKGHTFEGWYTEAQGGKRVWNSTEVYIGKDHTLYARWS